MSETDPTERDGVSRLSRRGLLALGATLGGTGGLGLLAGTASAAEHELTAFRDAFIGNDDDRQGLGSKGWLFFAKDTGTVYYHNATEWKDLGIGGELSDSDSDGLLEAPDHDGIDVGQIEADSISTENILSADGQLDIESDVVTADGYWLTATSSGSTFDKGGLRITQGYERDAYFYWGASSGSGGGKLCIGDIGSDASDARRFINMDLRDGSREIQFEDGSGNQIAALDLDTGDLEIAGTLDENTSF